MVDEENLYHTTNFASSMCGDGHGLDTVEEYGGGRSVRGSTTPTRSDTRGFNESVMSEASGWVPMCAYLVARRVKRR